MVKFSVGSIKIITMLVIFGIVAIVAFVSYLYLISLKNNSSSSLDKTPLKPSPKQKSLQNPQEYSDENLQIYFPDSLKLDIASQGAITWKAKLSDGSYMPNVMTLKKQDTPFTQPVNTSNNPYFSIDDTQGRVINSIDIMEYTVHCAYRCSRREDQFKIKNTYYQLTFDVFPPRFSEQAELILQTLKQKNTSPTPTKKAEQSICTQEAKRCSDGSYVNRQGANCEFSACPK